MFVVYVLKSLSASSPANPTGAGTNRAPPVDKPVIEQLTDGLNPGELLVSVNRVVNVRTYLFQYSLDHVVGDGAWVSIASTSRKNTFENLQSGKRRYVRVVAPGVGKQMAYSEVVSHLVQKKRYP